MTVGLDLDGCLACFYPAYEKLCIEVQGEDLFKKHYWPAEYPCTWDWPQMYGYTDATMKEVWQRIKESGTFWTYLTALERLSLESLDALDDHDVYFITDRPGLDAKWQTEFWLQREQGIKLPTVILSKRGKGIVAQALDLDVHVDDKGENILDVEAKSPKTRAYLLNRPYNSHVTVERRATSVEDVARKEWLK